MSYTFNIPSLTEDFVALGLIKAEEVEPEEQVEMEVVDAEQIEGTEPSEDDPEVDEGMTAKKVKTFKGRTKKIHVASATKAGREIMDPQHILRRRLAKTGAAKTARRRYAKVRGKKVARMRAARGLESVEPRTIQPAFKETTSDLLRGIQSVVEGIDQSRVEEAIQGFRLISEVAHKLSGPFEYFAEEFDSEEVLGLSEDYAEMSDEAEEIADQIESGELTDLQSLFPVYEARAKAIFEGLAYYDELAEACQKEQDDEDDGDEEEDDVEGETPCPCASEGMACKHPKNKITTRTTPFFGPVSDKQNRAAHGNVTQIETCGVCGATRETNINGKNIERGKWTPAAEEGCERKK